MNDLKESFAGFGERPTRAAFAHGRERVSRALAGRFTVLESIGTTMDVELYLARNNSSGEEVIIKALTAGAARDFRKRELFYLEAFSASRLSHVNIASTSKAEETDGIHYSVIEHKKDAETLRNLISRSGWLEPARAIEIADQIASALDYAHTSGVLHLLLQPENILIESDGWVSVTDFGIEAASQYGWARQQRARFARPPYACYEQGAAVDHRADIYSLGAILYEMLTDRVPFDSDDDDYIKDRQMSSEPAPPHLILMDVPEEVSGIVMRMLERDPDGRPASASAVQTLLDSAMKSAVVK